MKQVLTIIVAVLLVLGISLPAAAVDPTVGSVGEPVAGAPLVGDDTDVQQVDADAVAAADDTSTRAQFTSEPKPTPTPVYAGTYSGPILNVWKGMMVMLPVDGAHIGQRWGTYGTRFHDGIDFFVAQGTPIHATADGTVVLVRVEGSIGQEVWIDHGDGVVSIYGHMIVGSPTVKAGQFVKAGTTIGLVGMSGAATGFHVHYGIRVNGQLTDPAPFLGL